MDTAAAHVLQGVILLSPGRIYILFRAFTRYKHLFMLKKRVIQKPKEEHAVIHFKVNPTHSASALTAKLTNLQHHLCSSFLPVGHLCCFVYSCFFCPCWRNTRLGIWTCEAFCFVLGDCEENLLCVNSVQERGTRGDCLWHTRRITNGWMVERKCTR